MAAPRWLLPATALCAGVFLAAAGVRLWGSAPPPRGMRASDPQRTARLEARVKELEERLALFERRLGEQAELLSALKASLDPPERTDRRSPEADAPPASAGGARGATPGTPR
ncbi:MAG: hypothetical protein D6731_11735 [Planctomycetota bacterium]|nr:MAG: hypothetical protein D6731_11735 [Planctomycetota bacterium]